MKIDLPKTYNPKELETKWYEKWEKSGYFKPKEDSDKDPFVIVIPPPNVTGILHMGHALNNTIQDILVRWHRMKQEPTLWVPGIDHAGIATQNVVEKKLAKEGKTRHDFSREDFLKQVWEWKEHHGSTIFKQLRFLGASCDWSRERFTMDEGLTKAVRECFVSLYEKDLIYQGYRIINWCPRCHTALSDEESPHKDVEGGLYYFKYPVKDSDEFVTIATTRPETMLGDTAVAVNPNDERNQHLIGKKLILPLLEREIDIVADDFVDKEFGSGCVKVTPAHDPNDFDMGKRHDLEFINIMNEDGSINENGGPYKGMSRFDARKKVLEDLTQKGLFIKKDTHMHAVGHCYRCDTVIEPFYSKQWFVKMKPMAEKATQVVREGRVQFVPDRWTKVYLNWMDGIRDWCISRQIWWGHRIPVWYCDDCEAISVSREDVTQCQKCNSKNVRQDEDVLDTWFSSWLWPFSTLGWPEKTPDLKTFYPTTDLVTASEIIFFWVARMVMAGCEFMGKEPFSTVNIHGTIRAGDGQKMSKSLGNTIDPLEIIDEVGADALRFSLMMITGSGQDAFLTKDKFEIGRNFANKIWNACRFLFMNLSVESFDDFELTEEEVEKLSLTDQWILSDLNKAIIKTNEALQVYRFNDAANELYHFFWHSFCDWYIEMVKPKLAEDGPKGRELTEKVLLHVIEKSLRLLHPLMPFQTEEIWQKIKPLSKKELGDSISLADWPEPNRDLIFDEAITKVELLQETTAILRNFRAENGIAPKKQIHINIELESDGHTIREIDEEIKLLTNTAAISFESVQDQKKKWLKVGVVKEAVFYIDAQQDIDLKKLMKHIDDNLKQLESYTQSLEKKLKNDSFKNKAPKEVYEKEVEKHEESLKKLKHFQEEKSHLEQLV